MFLKTVLPIISVIYGLKNTQEKYGCIPQTSISKVWGKLAVNPELISFITLLVQNYKLMNQTPTNACIFLPQKVGSVSLNDPQKPPTPETT